ncbi:hypothetical protein RN001_009516 [Aquatica leii]|uniref:P-type domain-containing protein n=1 Tax=Aquatica leii TaxID=1421715 RepID=A0AAN7Q2J0_9COLE|nr:hypothetical protein RN001_009516 [Aquatica leii]
MTRIRNLLIAWRVRRARQLNNSDSVSFEAFCNEAPPLRRPITKESSLSDGYKCSPKHVKAEEYVRFSAETSNNSKCTRPSLATILLLILLLAVFLILPIIYLLHCFGVVNVDHDLLIQHTHHTIKEKEHYVPSAKVHEELENSQREKEYITPPPKPNYEQCKLVKDEERFDCYPEDGANVAGCEARGCCWMPLKSKTKKKKLNVPLDVPYCFYPPNYETYKYVNITETAYGLTAFLKRSYKSAYPDDVEVIKMTVKYESENRLHIKFTDPSHSRFEPPYPEVPIVDKAASNFSYSLELNEENTGFRIVRKQDNMPIFDSFNLGNMIFADQFLQFSGRLPSSYIYGLGEHRSPLLLSTHWQRFVMFNHDGVPAENLNLYGSHPFYMVIENSGNTHGVFLLNSNAMEVILQPAPAITFRTIGGILDFYFFLGPTPKDVVNQYTDVIGKPFLPPYWSLGFHLCRFGYKSLNDTNKVLQRNIDAGIPIDTQWNDLDYMNNSNDFTYDTKNFKGLPEFVHDLHNKGMHYIPLIDPGVSASEVPGSYIPYDKGIEMDIFVKNSSGQPFIGKVWNRATTVWPDFTHPRTVDYWILMMKSMHEQFAFDGAWIDMNEPSNFLSGSFNGCPKSSLEDPPYLPAVDGSHLNYKTMCMTAKHFAGLHYNVHNLYGFTEAIVTNFALAEIRSNRPLVISRASFPGLGHYAGHWSGDVYSKWYDMKYTIPQLLNFGMFGVPLMGADICGFNGNTTAALCNRWMQLGAFYPFSRNHNTDDGIEQDPVALGSLVVASSKKALTVRYSLLPYLYTLFWLAHVNGETVARPLFFEFTYDKKTYNIDEQFLWGAAVMILPVLEEAKTNVYSYFPAGIWYDYYTRTPLESKGNNYNISAPLDTIPVYVRGGFIIPQQSPLPTTTESRLSKIQILAASDLLENASGQLYWDDGDSLNSVEERRYSLINFTMKSGELRSEPVWWGPENPPNLGLVTVLGVKIPVHEVTINQMSQEFQYDTIHKCLLIDNLDLNLKSSIVISWK